MLTELFRHTWKSLTRKRAKAASGTHALVTTTRPDDLNSLPASADEWHQRGILAAGAGAMETALAHHEAALRLVPDHFWAEVAAAGLAHQMGRLEYALGLYRHALTINAGHAAPILANMGVILKDLVRLREAIATYRHHKRKSMRPRFHKQLPAAAILVPHAAEIRLQVTHEPLPVTQR